MQPEKATEDFQLDDWLVQPSLNRLTRGEDRVQVEPKLMDVLAFLAANAGEVVSKDDITDAVWTDQFITDSVVTRAIAALRRALADDAHNPRYIETISKRGYRLIAPAVTARKPAAPQAAETPATWRGTAAAVPFVVGQWVRGERFYGRASQIAEILDGNRNWLWLLGTRRVGKTSLLKQLEHLTASSPEGGYFPVFWDLQGAESSQELHQDFADALLDTEDRLDRLGIGIDDVSADDLFISLGRLRRKLRSKKRKVLLLCDEVEELIQLKDKDPALLRKLRRALQSREDIRSVLASSIRLWALAEQKQDTSPFLHGFTPPVYIDILADDEARSLIRQAQLGAEARPGFDDRSVELIRERCGNHPYLIQLLCTRYLELGDLDEAFEQVATDSMVSFFFSVDFELLSPNERKIIHSIADRSAASSKTIQLDLPLDSPSLVGSLNRLEHLGFIRRDEDRRFYLVNYFFRRWLHNLPLTRPLSGAVAPRDGSRRGNGAPATSEDLLPRVYDELRRAARGYLRHERPGHTLQATALVHEAYLKLADQASADWQGRSHFLAVGARAMRRLLIDHARGHRRAKRGGDVKRVTLNEAVAPLAHKDLDFDQLLNLDAALNKLDKLDQRRAEIVELRFFAGLTIAEVAEHLGLSKRTVNTEWSRARAWLERELA